MTRTRSMVTCAVAAAAALGAVTSITARETANAAPPQTGATTVHRATVHDISGRLDAATRVTGSRDRSHDRFDHPVNSLAPSDDIDGIGERGDTTIPAPVMVAARGSAAIEQRAQGRRAAPSIVASFAGLGADFVGPQGNTVLHNPSDNSLAVGPDHIVQIVNSRMAVFTKRGSRYPTTGVALYGPVETSNVFKGFGGACETHNNGDAVARYDQLANRWLIVMPIFTRLPVRANEPPEPTAAEGAVKSLARDSQPGRAAELYQPPHAAPTELPREDQPRRSGAQRPPAEKGSYAMCYAVSTGADPLGSYYRYEFVRPLFPDYPRPAIWPDGYYVPTSTGDAVIQKHACVADRAKMLKGEDATEQCVIVDNVNFLNNADLDGRQLPPKGAPNIVMAAGGTQLKKSMEDDGIYVWKFHVDWADASKTRLDGPTKLVVTPYHYLCDGQLTNCVPQPGTDRRLDAQGDKLMARLVYRRIGAQQSIAAVHSVNTSVGGGGVRWYEFRINGKGDVQLHQQGTFAPDSAFRWLGSAAMDRVGNIGIGYSFGGAESFAGQRFAGRLASDPPGQMGMKEAILATGSAAQTSTLRWEDYTQTAVDPSDDCTIWYVGDYLMPGNARYSTRIGGFRMPGCR